jgi:arylsulfatase A-like enzyme
VATAANSDRPNVIILGIDSLRLEQLRRFGGSGATPNLDRFLATADLFPDTTTPAARTYPSWSAILTSRAPNVTGARFNLANRSEVKITPTVGDVLRKAGYRTVYSTDEVRFANFDETYGFDQVVTPRIGASDFILGSYNEFPLASMVVNTPIARWMFPFSYGNRGAATMYHPETFVDRIRREVSFDQPTLFISHLTAAHWPYFTGDIPFGVPISTPDDPNSMYRTGLRTADRMFGELLQILEAKGALRNALVIVLSDHGEAFGMPSDSFFDHEFVVDGLRAPLQMVDRGHGQSVLSKSQYHLLLSFKTFGTPVALGVAARGIPFPATAEDVSPTILDFLGIKGDPLASTGRSLLPFLEGDGTIDESDRSRIRFTETDLAVLPAPGGRVDEVGTARKNALFFEVDPKSGRLQMRHRLVPIAKGYKERAAFTKDMLLAAMPAGPHATQYLLLDFNKFHGNLLMARPTDNEPDAQRLWDALEDHFHGELREPVAVTPEDWPRITKEWKYFTAESTHPPATGAGQGASKVN